MKPFNFLLLLLTSLMLVACSPDNSPKPKLFEEQRDALDKAKGVDTMLQQQAAEARKTEEKQTQ